jgi:uncharacterized protein (TIRG00374 family)
LRQVSAGFVVAIFLAYVANMYTNGLFIKYIIQPFKKSISVSESLRVALISSLGNFFAPSGAGLGFRAIYLKKRHQLGYSDYLSTVYGNYLLLFIICALAGLLSLATSQSHEKVQFGGAALFFVGLLVLSVGLSFVKIPSRLAKQRRLKKVTSILETMTTGWQLIIKNRRLLTILTGLIIGQLIITILIARFETLAIGAHLSWSGLLLFAVLGSLSIFINITPANLGVKEAVFVATASIIGLTTPQILAVALLDRAVLFATLGL